MKTLVSGAITATAVALLVTAAVAQQAAQKNQYQHAAGAQTVVRASDVIGMDVRNHTDEDLGSIEDLAINPDTGKIEYAAVSMGGFLGVGDKLFAVPWSAITCRPETGEENQAPEDQEKVAVVNLDKEAMKNAEGFDKEHWPDMADNTWRMQNDRPFQSQRPTGHPIR